MPEYLELPSVTVNNDANKFGRESELFIRTSVRDGITRLTDTFFTAPYKISRPFYDSGSIVLNVILMSASAGIMEGDCYRINVHLGRESRMALHGQSYNKIHRMKQGCAEHFNRFVLEEGAFFDFAPQPTIPFADSRFHSYSECFLQNNSAFLFSEILAGGRVKKSECFAFKEYRNAYRIYYQGEMKFIDNQWYIPEFQRLNGIGFFEGYTHQGTLAYFCDRWDHMLLERLHTILEGIPGIEFGLSRIQNFGVIVRILGNSSDELEKICTSLREEIYRVEVESE